MEDVLKVIQMVATDGSDHPRTAVTIANCGQLGLLEDAPIEKGLTSSSSAIQKSKKINPYLSNSDSPAEDTAEIPEQDVENKTEEEETKVEEREIDLEEQTKGMSATQKKIFLLRMKINQSRVINKAETVAEYKRFTDPKYDAKQRYMQKKQQALRGVVVDDFDGGDMDETTRRLADASTVSAAGGQGKPISKEELKVKNLMNITAEATESYKEKIQAKEENLATFGWHAFTQEADYRAYEKQLKKLSSSSSSSSAAGGGEIDAFDYGKDNKVSKDGLNRLGQYMTDRDEQRNKFSRRRAHMDAVGDSAINDANEIFNKKIARSFDKYTVEIRQNLERGTAI